MANRVLLGKRGSDYGLFVSQKDVDVTNTSLTTPLAFDSRSVRGLSVRYYGQGLIPASNAPSFGSNTITHSMGYIPAYAVRWSKYSYGGDMNNIYTSAITVREPSWHEEQENSAVDDPNDPSDPARYWEYDYFGCRTSMTSSALQILNACSGYTRECDSGYEGVGQCPSELSGGEVFGVGKIGIAYAYVIFEAKDFTGGKSL